MPIPPESPKAPAAEPAGTFTRTRLSRIVDPLRARTPSTPMPPPVAVASPAVLLAVAVLPDTKDLRIVPLTQPELGLVQSSSPAMSMPPVVACASMSLVKASASVTVFAVMRLASMVSVEVRRRGLRKNGVLAILTPPPSANRPYGREATARFRVTTLWRSVRWPCGV